MAENQDQGEKSEEPTQQRREDFRRRGQVAQTRELSSVFSLLFAGIMVWFLGRFFLEQINEVFVRSLSGYLIDGARFHDWQGALLFSLKKTALIVGPVVGIVWVVALASSALQVGIIVNEEALKLKFDRLDLVKGFKRIFSLRSVVEGLKATFKVVIVAGIAALVIEDELAMVPQLVNFSVGQIFSYLGDITIKLLAGAGAFMLVLAGLDYLFQRFELEKQMRMTKQEVKEELKSREGDPLVKARIKRVQRELATRRMMDEVPKADVVITNPTHIAVAIKYSEAMVAPCIVAMGAGEVAKRIKDLAKEHGVPTVENKPLARTMFKTLKVGMQIPRDLYTAVAEVLSYVYRLKAKRKGS